MRKRTLIKNGALAFLPQKYRSVLATPFPILLKQTLLWLILLLLVGLLIGLPHILSLANNLEERLSPLESFTIDADVSLNDTIILLERPTIAIDLAQENISKEKILVNNDGVYYKKSFWRGTTFTPWDSITQVHEHVSLYSKLLTMLTILLLPSLVVVLFVLFVLEAVIVALLVTLLTFLITKLTKFYISLKSIIKISLLALVPMFVVQLLPLVYIRLFIPGLIVYLLYVVAGIWIVGEGKTERKVKDH